MCQYKNIYITIGSNGREYILNILMRHPNLVRAIFYHLGLDNLVNEVSAVCSAKNLTKFEHSSSSKHPELLEVQMRKLWYNYLVVGTLQEIWHHTVSCYKTSQRGNYWQNFFCKNTYNFEVFEYVWGSKKMLIFPTKIDETWSTMSSVCSWIHLNHLFK